MSRADLLALQPAALASLTNMGLVKRAQKELEQGKVPAIVVEDDGTVVATFDDATTRLVPGKGLRDVPCTCGATSGCRHRVGAVLAYQQWSVSSSTTSIAGAATTAPAAEPVVPWSPADVDDEALVRLLGEGTVDRARKVRRAGYIAEVRAGSGGDDAPMVLLQTSSVRFLVRGDASYARCDCVQKSACLHVALAVWAFRARDAKDAAAATLVVEVREPGALTASLVDDDVQLALRATIDVVRLVVIEGLQHWSAASTARVALARDALTRANLAWPLLALQELELLLEQYLRRSALFQPHRLRHVLVELVARVHAGRGDGVLPARSVLGRDEVLSTKLDQARFVGIGVTVEADDDDRRVQVLLADPGGQGIFAIERLFRKPDTGVEDGPMLAARTMVGGASLAVLASGQMVSNAVTRQANRVLTVGVGGLQKTSVTRGGFSVDRMPVDRVTTSVDESLQQRRARPPVFLRPRLVADDVEVVVIDEVRDVVFDPARQAVIAVCHDAHGAVIVVERVHKAVAPGAGAALAAAMLSTMTQPGGAAKVTAVVGRVHVVGDALVVEAISVVADRLIVLDLEAKTETTSAALSGLATGRRPEAATTLATLADGVIAVLDDVVRDGVRGTGSQRDRWHRHQHRLREAGLLHLAHDLEHLTDATTAYALTGSDVDAAAAADAWAACAVRATFVVERC
jgi:hypothetical protein